MCDPISIASGAALAGGTLLTGMGRQSANRAATGTMHAEGARQRGFRDQAAGSWNKSVDALEKPAQDKGLSDAQGARTAALKGNVTNFSAIPMDGVGSAPKVITDAYAGAAKSATDAGLDYAGRTGALEGYGDQLFTRSLGIGRSRQDIDKYGNFSRGSMSVLPMEMEGAATKGSTMRGVGELFSGLGNLGLLYGFTRPAVGNVSVPGGSSVLRSAGTIPGIGRIR